ncbi:MFS transporter, partial [Candidatus Omnitrophota bacterium]
FCVGRFFIPAKLSIVPDLVEQESLLMANSLINTTAMIAAVLGFGIGGLLVEWLGAKGGFCLNAAGFFVSGTLIFAIRKRKPVHFRLKEFSKEIVEVIRKSVIQEIKEGIVYFIKQREVRLTGLIMFYLGGALGAIYVVMIVFVQNALQSVTRDLGFMIMFLGAGLFMGSLIYGRFGGRLSHFKVIFFSLVLTGLTLIVFVSGLTYYPHFIFAASLAVVLGMVAAPIVISCTTLIHNSSQNEMMGRVFTSLEVLLHLGFFLFMFLSSFLAKWIPPGAILIFVACSFVVLGVLNLIFHRKIPWLN